MPQRKSGIKELRVNKRKHLQNLQVKTDIKKAAKNFRALVEEKKTQEASSALKTLYKKIDKAVKRDLIHRNTAARRKSLFAKLLRSKA